MQNSQTRSVPWVLLRLMQIPTFGTGMLEIATSI